MVSLPKSAQTSQLSRLLIIAPIGIYLKRVKRGIDNVLFRQTALGETKVRVILVAGQDWIQTDLSYKTEFVDKLKDYVLSIWKQEAGLDVVCDVTVLPMDDEEYLTGWLLKELSLLFKTSGIEAGAFVDLTSAPREWLFAAINVLNFFPNVELYYVKPMYRKSPKDYTESEIHDEGHPKLEVVRTSYGRQALRQWTEPKDHRGMPNLQYLLFRTIFRFAQKIAKEKALDPSRLDEVWVPIKEQRGLEEYRSSIAKSFRRNSSFSDDSRLRKSISKHLTIVEAFGLFEVKGKSVRITLRAVMLGQTLFAGIGKHRR